MKPDRFLIEAAAGVPAADPWEGQFFDAEAGKASKTFQDITEQVQQRNGIV